MSEIKEPQIERFENAVIRAAAAIRGVLDAIEDAPMLSKQDVQRGFNHLQGTIGIVLKQAMNVNELARTSNFSLTEPAVFAEPVAPVDPDEDNEDENEELIIAPPRRAKRNKRGVKQVDMQLVQQEGRATLRVVGELPVETGNADMPDGVMFMDN